MLRLCYFHKPFFFHYFEPNTSSEIDFIIYNEDEITPLEVKGGIHTRSTSFNALVEKYKPQKSFRFSEKNIGFGNNGTVYLPLYDLSLLLDNEKNMLSELKEMDLFN